MGAGWSASAVRPGLCLAMFLLGACPNNGNNPDAGTSDLSAVAPSDLAAAGAADLSIPAATLALLSPANESVVAGDNALLVALSSDPFNPAPTSIVFEWSSDGATWHAILPREAPDFGLPFASTTFDTTALPAATMVTLRTRFSASASGPTVKVKVDRLPVESCTASGLEGSITVDCTASTDPDGTITTYAALFGDGASVSQATPVIKHTYGGPGSYDLDVIVKDNDGKHARRRYVVNIDMNGGTDVTAATECGCKVLHLKRSGSSKLDLPGTGASVTLGVDGGLAHGNQTIAFEPEAELTPHSDPALCPEGQRVRRTTVITDANGNQTTTCKKACSKGRRRAICDTNADCERATCMGGADDGKAVNSIADENLCVAGGGTLMTVPDGGICSVFPYADGGTCGNGPPDGAVVDRDAGLRGNDNYTSPEDDGPKKHPADGGIVWLDSPGWYQRPVGTAGVAARYEADFVSFVYGKPDAGTSCSCHFHLVVEFDIHGNLTAATNVELIRDGETFNCD